MCLKEIRESKSKQTQRTRSEEISPREVEE
jgi:hypothetical protein